MAWLEALIESSSSPSIFVFVTSIDAVEEWWLKADKFDRPCIRVLVVPPHRAVAA